MNRNSLTAAVALLLLALVAPVAQAVTPIGDTPKAAAHDSKSLVGELTERDPAGKTFAVKADQTLQRFVLATDAKVMNQEGRTIQLADLKIGARLEITYTVNGSTMTATQIEVVS